MQITEIFYAVFCISITFSQKLPIGRKGFQFKILFGLSSNEFYPFLEELIPKIKG